MSMHEKAATRTFHHSSANRSNIAYKEAVRKLHLAKVKVLLYGTSDRLLL
jgi:hypothetical protein